MQKQQVQVGFWAALGSLFGFVYTSCNVLEKTALFVEKRVITADELISNEEENIKAYQTIRLDTVKAERKANLAALKAL